MAVAVKTSQDARSAKAPASAAMLSLVGVVYLLACLVIVFKLLPEAWWSAWAALNLGPPTVVGGTILVLVALALGIGFLVLGARLLGSHPPVGVRAGVFVAFLGLLAVVLLTRWASLWIEHWAYETGSPSAQTGLSITIGIGVGLLLLGLYLFTRPGLQGLIVRLEEAGWFHATPYKSNQGQKVRRGTVLGLLLIVGAGIYTMVTHNVLGRGAADWAINLPFTGKVALESYGDTRELASAKAEFAKGEVEVRWEGKSSFHKGEVVPFAKYKTEVEQLLQQQGLPPIALDDTDPAAFVLAVNERVLGKQMEKLLADKYYPEGEEKRLEFKYQQTHWEGMGEVVGDFYRAALIEQQKDKQKEMPKEFAIPAAVVVVDRYALRDVNGDTDEAKNVKIKFKGDSDFEEGKIVSAEKFAEEENRLRKLQSEGRDRVLPTKVPLTPASGKVQFASITLLPSVQYTLPLLLLAGSLWLAWRVVNMPAFADFLIATEAELNKVSWTTQKKLVQDTIVVLVTVVLMAVFLFGMDYTWKIVLSWKPIGVLHIPDEEPDAKKSIDQKSF